MKQRVNLSLFELDLICELVSNKIDALPKRTDLSQCNIEIEKCSDCEISLTFNNFN